MKAEDGWPPTPHCTSWLKGYETEISIAGKYYKVQCYVLYSSLAFQIVLMRNLVFKIVKGYKH